MSRAYRFGTFELQPIQRQLLADGQPSLLGPRAFDLLVALVERAGTLVTKQELLRRVWPNLVVEENNLQVQVSTLRKVLGNNAIATIPGQGYRFALEVSAEASTSNPAPVASHNLPVSVASFVGHEDDLAECEAMLSGTRLVTLTGIGGCGKTRLAIELASRVVKSYADGVWLVDLAAVADPERVPLAVASALDVRAPGSAAVLDAVRVHLAGRDTLLVLDNCEHLAHACRILVGDLLAAAPRLRVLATSREGLNVPGERTMTVRSLRTPAEGAQTEAIASSEAVRLFVDRARSADRSFALDSRTAPVVAEICRRLDGIPLAIELAAARAKVLSVEEIRKRLDDRFRLLVSGRPALPRQQTLLAVIRWSYDHLPPDEQRVLRLLSVFAGGWTLAAAVTVIGDADEYVVLDVLARLVDRSLVVVERERDGTSRYSMLETVRQYAQEQLDHAGEGLATRDRHLDYYLALAQQPVPVHSGRQRALWGQRLRRELENLMLAFAWSREKEDGASRGLALAVALRSVSFHSGLLHLGYDVLSKALDRYALADATRMNALLDIVPLAYLIDRFADGRAKAEEALALARRFGDDAAATRATLQIAHAINEEGNAELARPLYEDALANARAIGRPALLRIALNAMGDLHRGEGEIAAARALYEEVLAIARSEGNVVAIAQVSDNLARLLIAAGRVDEGRDLVREVFAISRDAGSIWVGLCALDITCALAAHDGNWVFAARMRGAAEARIKALRYRRERVDDAFLAPWTARIEAAMPASEYRLAYDAGHALSDDVASAEASAWLSTSESDEG